MADVSKRILAAVIAVAGITTPALAAHNGKPTSSHHHTGYVTRSSQGSSIYDFVSAPRSFQPSDPAFTSPPRDPRSWVGDPAGRPYVYVPGQASGGGGY